MFGATALPAAVFFLGMFFVPESPRWLALRGREQEARRTLVRLGGEESAAIVLAEIEESVRAAEHRAGFAAELKQLLAPGLRAALALGVSLAVLQQWCGINVIFNYAEEIYRRAGYGVNDILFNIVITGSVNLVFTVLAFGFVDKVGRRPLMLFGCTGIGFCHFLMGLAYRLGLTGLPVLLLTLSAIGFYAMTLAPITWVLISEIFPNRVRSAAVSISVSALWIASFVLTYTFPLIGELFGSAGTFWLYAAICLLGFLFVRARVPETKGRTLEQIEHELAGPA
jgi:sugar porter (SP) family MFS transporter